MGGGVSQCVYIEIFHERVSDGWMTKHKRAQRFETAPGFVHGVVV